MDNNIGGPWISHCRAYIEGLLLFEYSSQHMFHPATFSKEGVRGSGKRWTATRRMQKRDAALVVSQHHG